LLTNHTLYETLTYFSITLREKHTLLDSKKKEFDVGEEHQARVKERHTDEDQFVYDFCEMESEILKLKTETCGLYECVLLGEKNHVDLENEVKELRADDATVLVSQLAADFSAKIIRHIGKAGVAGNVWAQGEMKTYPRKNGTSYQTYVPDRFFSELVWAYEFKTKANEARPRYVIDDAQQKKFVELIEKFTGLKDTSKGKVNTLETARKIQTAIERAQVPRNSVSHPDLGAIPNLKSSIPQGANKALFDAMADMTLDPAF
jgi:hypothetical protein